MDYGAPQEGGEAARSAPELEPPVSGEYLGAILMPSRAPCKVEEVVISVGVREVIVRIENHDAREFGEHDGKSHFSL
jgi:hypothetical protein